MLYVDEFDVLILFEKCVYCRCVLLYCVSLDTRDFIHSISPFSSKLMLFYTFSQFIASFPLISPIKSNKIPIKKSDFCRSFRNLSVSELVSVMRKRFVCFCHFVGVFSFLTSCTLTICCVCEFSCKFFYH